MYGARYRAEPVDPTGHRVAEALTAVAADVAAGWPVPLLRGYREPRRWVLAIAATDDTLTCYEPTDGRIARITLHDLGREMSLLALVYPVRHA
jgi:hypothetical protein